MSLNFFDMLREEQEKEKKLAEELSKPKKTKEKPKTDETPKEQVNNPVEEKVSQKPKKEPKTKLSFEEQYKKIKGTPVQRVIDHLLELGMKELMEHPNVTIEGMWKYITAEAKKQAVGGSACIEDEEVYGWGRHYYDEHGKVAR